jgi:transposase-like protein
MGQMKNYSKDFKFKVALEMIKGDLTIREIISKYQVPRSVVSRWKRQLLDNGSEIFKSGNQAKNVMEDQAVEKLHATIGKLKVENDFLQKASAKLL